MKTHIIEALKCTLFYLILFNFTGCHMEENGMRTEEAQGVYSRLSLDGDNFDVPTTYFFQEFKTSGVGEFWPRPRPDRRNVDVFTITGIFPNMAPYTEQNYREFEDLVRGKKVMMSLRAPRMDWTYYFQNVVPRLVALETSSETPLGFKKWLDPSPDKTMEKEIYMNDDKAHPSLIRISCDLQGGVLSPGCQVITEYREKYELKYSFSRDYLEQWIEIDRTVKATLDRFMQSAKLSNK